MFHHTREAIVTSPAKVTSATLTRRWSNTASTKDYFSAVLL